jgi:hypothetical protein
MYRYILLGGFSTKVPYLKVTSKHFGPVDSVQTANLIVQNVML